MATYYFNTGVNPNNVYNPPFPYEYHKKVGNVIRGGTLQIPFKCNNVPENMVFKFACDNPNLPHHERYFVAEIRPGSNLHSKYAYFL